SLAIRITDVVVPSTVEVGGGADLDCKWENDDDQMYSIKWYQAAYEFYRYTPTAVMQKVQIFDLPTLDVDYTPPHSYPSTTTTITYSSMYLFVPPVLSPPHSYPTTTTTITYSSMYLFVPPVPSPPPPPCIYLSVPLQREKSWGGSVRIANVTLAAAGPFHCEVSGDSPTFYTASLSSTLTVVDLPDGGPVVTGVRSSYVAGDWVDLICSTRRSRPPPTLSYTLNTRPAPAGWLEPQENHEDEEGLITSTLRLRFSLQRQLLQEGDVQVACVAEIPNVYREEARDILSTTPPYHASGLGAAPGGTGRRHCHTALSLLLLLAHQHL
ncbi:hypothetical protein Pmani_027671, partial [Petrolisthes manimaculis]